MSATVLPPVFGPVMSSIVAGGMILIVTGTGVLEQRMPRRLQLERAVGRQRRLDAVDRLREARARLQHVELGRRVDRALQIAGARAERVGQREQDAPDLLGFLLLERDDVVVDLDGAERLEEQARAARRRAVHDARNAAAVLGLARRARSGRCAR